MFELTITSQFAAAHQLRNFKQKCERLHGHNWRVDVCIRSPELDTIGLVRDFGEIKKTTRQVLQELDHRFLNEIPPFDDLNPSSELLARYLFKRLSERIDEGPIRVSRVSVWESENSCASYWEEGENSKGSASS
jgi:6-pyruvoyltetrahydropterin/6-carboxytetrahydropterin synthase